VHHLISPTDGLPGGAGLAAVTVVDSDPAEAEVWSKVLFLSGRDGIRTATAFHGLAALWVASDGELAWSEPMADRLAWTRR
jgi:FAD:protein FMN transferase